jgi:hypothetical protein
MSTRTGPYLPERDEHTIEIPLARLRELAAEREGLQQRLEAALSLCDEWEIYARQYPAAPPAQFAQAIRRTLRPAS